MTIEVNVMLNFDVSSHFCNKELLVTTKHSLELTFSFCDITSGTSDYAMAASLKQWLLECSHVLLWSLCLSSNHNMRWDQTWILTA